MKKNKNGLGSKGDLRHLEMESASVSSSGDQTGLIPAALKSRSEKESYEDLRDFTNDPRQ